MSVWTIYSNLRMPSLTQVISADKYDHSYIDTLWTIPNNSDRLVYQRAEIDETKYKVTQVKFIIRAARWMNTKKTRNTQ